NVGCAKKAVLPQGAWSGRCLEEAPNNGPEDTHPNKTADTTINNQLSGKGLHCIKAHAHPDRCDFQQDTKPNSCNHAAAGETARIDHHECKNDQCLADNDPMKQAHHFTLRPPEVWCLRVNIFEKNAVKQPAPQE